MNLKLDLFNQKNNSKMMLECIVTIRKEIQITRLLLFKTRLLFTFTIAGLRTTKLYKPPGISDCLFSILIGL